MIFSEDSIFSPTYKKSSPFIQRGHSVDTCPGSPIASKETNCQISTLLMIIHSGSVLGKIKLIIIFNITLAKNIFLYILV